jgi:hypothetical protein
MPEFESFDWNGGNAEKNWERHHVTPAEAEQVFFNRPMVVAKDAKHSDLEKRFYVLGQTDEERKLFIGFTMRERLIRVISVRDMSRSERRIYES